MGAPGDSSIATGVNGDEKNVNAKNSGAAYLFRRAGGAWSQQAYIKASNTREGAFLGESLALSGATLAVGSTSESSLATGVNGSQAAAPDVRAGAVYVVR